MAGPLAPRETTYSVQWRCPNMGKHGAVPCPKCYSLLIATTRIPYREDMQWKEELISGIDRFGVCCCPTATMLNQIWRVIESEIAYCYYCGRLPGSDQ